MKRNMERKRVLFADDDPDFRDFMRDAVGEIGSILGVEIELIEAPDGAEAIRLFDSSLFDFVLTDYKMPKATAVDVIRHIMHTNPVPIIVISGVKEAANVDFVSEGALIFVSKPFNFETVCNAFQAVLNLCIADEDLIKAKWAIKRLEKLIP